MINIDEEVIYAECDVLIALSDCYIKEFLMEMNGCDSSQLFMESSKPKKSIKEAGKKLWQMFIKALQTLQRWFHKKTKFVFMKKRMQKATPKEMQKFQKALDNIDECLNDIDELFTNEMYDMLEPMNSHSTLNLLNFHDSLVRVINNHAYKFALTNDDEKLVEKAHYHTTR